MIPVHDDNPTHIIPWVTMALIAACVLTYIWQVLHDPHGQQVIVYALGVIPAVLIEDAALAPEISWLPAGMTIFTSMFLHGGFMHLAGNMLYLWVFGNNIEDAMGHVRFIVFYLLCGVIAVYAYALPESGSVIPMIGASGAISGVLGAYLLLHPKARVLVIIPLGFYPLSLRLPAVFVLVFWFVMQLVNSFSNNEQGGIAFAAHIGGFIAGMLLIVVFKHKSIPIRHPFSN